MLSMSQTLACNENAIQKSLKLGKRLTLSVCARTLTVGSTFEQTSCDAVLSFRRARHCKMILRGADPELLLGVEAKNQKILTESFSFAYTYRSIKY